MTKLDDSTEDLEIHKAFLHAMGYDFKVLKGKVVRITIEGFNPARREKGLLQLKAGIQAEMMLDRVQEQAEKSIEVIKNKIILPGGNGA